MRNPARSVRALLAMAFVTAAGGMTAKAGAVRLAHAPQAATQPPAAGQDIFAFVRALDAAASRGVWPGFDPSAIPVALFDGERTVLLRHPSPPAEFAPMPGRPGVLVATGRYPAVTSNSTREIGGVRTATVIATPAQSIDSTMLAVVEEVFHVFWLARHPAFRPNELARYAYPLEDANNLRALLAEDEALARALEAPLTGDAARWAAAALEIRRTRAPALADDVRAYETSLEMMEGTANYVARVGVGEPVSRTVERLRAPRPAENIRWRFYDTGTALCLLLDRLGPGWQARSEREPAITLVDLMGAALRVRDVAAAVFPAADAERFLATAAGSTADLRERRQRLRAELRARPGVRIVIDVEMGAEPFRAQRFDPINLVVLGEGDVAHPNYLTLAVPQGTVELTKAGFVRGSFGGTVAVTESAGRHPLADGVRRLTIYGIQGSPKAVREGDSVVLEAPGVRLTLRGADLREEGGQIRVTVKEPGA